MQMLRIARPRRQKFFPLRRGQIQLLWRATVVPCGGGGRIKKSCGCCTANVVDNAAAAAV